MRSKSSLYNLLAAMILQIVTLIVGIILPRVMILTFGSEINGLVSSIRQFISYLSLVEAGLSGASIYALYKPLSKKDYNQINIILSESKRFYNRSGVIFSILAFILAFIFPFIAKTDSISNINIIIITLILGINGSLEFFSMGKYRSLLTADQKSYIISFIQIVGQVLNCIIIVVMSICKFNIVLVQLVATASYLVRSIMFKRYVNKRYRYLDFNAKANNKVLHQRGDVLLHQIGAMVVFNSPIALITLFCSLTEVSIYTVYNMIFVGVSGIIGIFNNGLVAGIGDIISRDDILSLKKVYKEYECGYYMIVTWVYTCTYILILPFIRLYTKGVSDGNYISSSLAFVFTIIGVLNALRTPQSTVVSAAGHFKKTRYRAMIEITINIIASLILVNCLGMIGVLLGSICSYFYRTIDFIIYTPRNITKLRVSETIIRIIRGGFLAIIIIIPFKTIIAIECINFIQWIMWAVIISGWAGIIIFLGNYVSEKSTLNSLISRFKMIIFKSRDLNKIKSI